MSFSSPNHTQVPNDLFEEWLPKLTESELKLLLVLIRKTLGFHRKSFRLSVRGAEKLTGLSHRTIQVAGAGLIEKGLVEKLNDGGVSLWTVLWDDTPATSGGMVGGVLLDSTPDQDDADGAPPVLPSSTAERGQVAHPVLPGSTPSMKERSKESPKEREPAASRPPSHDQTPWVQILTLLRRGMDRAEFDTWVQPTDLLSLAGDVLTIGAASSFGVERLQSKHREEIEAAAREVLGRAVRVRFIVANKEAA
jgi:hypothetical protein